MHRRKHHRAYGIIWDESQSSPALSRIGQGQSCPAAAKLPDNLMALQSKMRSCLLSDAGVVQYYTGATDRTKKEDMVTPSDLTGADGQVMVEIPLGWHKYWYANSKHYHLISREQFNGANRLDAFYKNDEWVKNRYIGAYEGVLYDVSANRYTNGLYLPACSITFINATSVISCTAYNHPFTRLEVGDKISITGTTYNNGTFTVAVAGDQSITVSEGLTDETAGSTVLQTQKDWSASTGDKLSSVANKTPINQGTRASFRAVAKNRGAGWRQQDYDLVSAIQLFYLVEYASWYSQSMIGAGLTNFGGTNWLNRSNYNPIEKTGLSNGLGNASGGVDNGSNALGSYMSYRGVENLYGHVWKWVDGININDCVPYVCNNDTHFADNTTTHYTSLGVTLAGSNGWQKTLAQITRGFLPVSVGGSSSTYITDYYYQYVNWRVATLGGIAPNGANAGIAYWALSYSSGNADRKVVGRLSR